MNLSPLARDLRKKIGAQHRLIGTGVSDERFASVQRESDEAVALAKYLICHLDSRAAAVTFADQVGMPGYINMR